MLAYLLWHHLADGIERDAYEDACERFHRSLRHSPPAGFRGSAVFRVGESPWLAPAPAETGMRAESECLPASAAAGIPAKDRPPAASDAYEDWYFLDDFAALGVLNEAAVAHSHRGAHDDLARRFGAGAGGLYGLLEGHADLAGAPLAVWVSRPAAAGRLGEASAAGVPRPAPRPLGELLGDGMDPQHASLWRRALVLGPAPEYCQLTREPPAGVAPTRQPDGWRALTSTRELLWPRG